jgi:hypothetical protein
MGSSANLDGPRRQRPGSHVGSPRHTLMQMRCSSRLGDSGCGALPRLGFASAWNGGVSSGSPIESGVPILLTDLGIRYSIPGSGSHAQRTSPPHLSRRFWGRGMRAPTRRRRQPMKRACHDRGRASEVEVAASRWSPSYAAYL